jgi:hypothetical protein
MTVKSALEISSTCGDLAIRCVRKAMTNVGLFTDTLGTIPKTVIFGISKQVPIVNP